MRSAHLPASTRVLGLSLLLALGAGTGPALAIQSAPPAPPPPPGAGGQDSGAGGGGGQQEVGRDRGQGGGRMFGGGGRRGGFGGGGGGGMRDIREQLDPDFVRRDVPIFVRQLKLDDAQATVVETLMHDYEMEFTPASEEIQTQLTELGRTMFQTMFTPQMREGMQGEMQKIQEDMRKLEEEKGGPLDEEARRQFFRDRMQKVQQRFAEERAASGAGDEMKKTVGAMLGKVDGWARSKDAMRVKFVEGLQASLSDDQLAQWPAFERFLAREKTLPRGRLSGESTNLFFVADEQSLPAEEFARIEKTLDEYEIRLDGALKSRNEYMASSMSKLFRAIQEGDANEATRIIERQIELRAAVRDVNEDYRGLIVTALGDTEYAKKFERAALEAGFERIFRPTQAERSFEKALEMTGLTAEVRASIEQLQLAYLNELKNKNTELLAATRKNEPPQQVSEATRFVTMMASAMSGDFTGMGDFGPGRDRGADPVREGFDARGKLGDGYVDQLKALLTPEQVAELPRGGGGGGGGRMGRMLESLPEAQRAEIMKRVDKNGNGQIDDDERDEMFRQIREQGGGFGGGADGQRRGGA